MLVNVLGMYLFLLIKKRAEHFPVELISCSRCASLLLYAEKKIARKCVCVRYKVELYTPQINSRVFSFFLHVYCVLYIFSSFFLSERKNETIRLERSSPTDLGDYSVEESFFLLCTEKLCLQDSRFIPVNKLSFSMLTLSHTENKISGNLLAREGRGCTGEVISFRIWDLYFTSELSDIPSPMRINTRNIPQIIFQLFFPSIITKYKKKYIYLRWRDAQSPSSTEANFTSCGQRSSLFLARHLNK